MDAPCVTSSKPMLGAFLRGRAVDPPAKEGQLDSVYESGSYTELIHQFPSLKMYKVDNYDGWTWFGQALAVL